MLWLCLQDTLRQALDAGLLVNNPYHVILVLINIHYFESVLWLCLQGTLRQALDAGLLVNNPYHDISLYNDINYFIKYPFFLSN
jgi:hypothetical protein